LQEVSALKQQYEQLSAVLEGSDMQKMLDVYIAMKRSLETLTKVPEFSGVTDKAAVLEARLKEMAVPQLAAAIRDQEGACCPVQCVAYTSNTGRLHCVPQRKARATAVYVAVLKSRYGLMMFSCGCLLALESIFLFMISGDLGILEVKIDLALSCLT
jgi:hypothetical protein